MVHIIVKAFKAVNEPTICKRYIQGHREVLEKYGIQQITSAKESWVNNPLTYVIIAQSKDTGELLGGIRVQKASKENPLPIQTAIGDLDSRINDSVNNYIDSGAGELCGLWNSPKVAGHGLSYLLTRMGISILNQVNINVMFGICAELTLNMFKNVGFQVDDSLGNNGTFFYPRPDLIAYSLIIEDTINLPHAEPGERARIFDLRNDLKKNDIIVHGPKGEINIEYNLIIPCL